MEYEAVFEEKEGGGRFHNSAEYWLLPGALFRHAKRAREGSKVFISALCSQLSETMSFACYLAYSDSSIALLRLERAQKAPRPIRKLPVASIIREL